MKHLKPLLSTALAAALLLGALGGCGARKAEQKEPAPTPEPTITPTLSPAETADPAFLGWKGDEIVSGNGGFTEFDSTLIAFLERSGYEKENFMVSPLSFRAALALAVFGADGETKDALLRAMGFASMDEVRDWYAGLLEAVDRFAEELEQERGMQRQYPEDFGGGEADRAFRIANSVWHNADKEGNFSAEYIESAARQFDAAASDLPGAELTKAVNDWANEKTEGMIPAIVGDLSQADAVLVNALYLRTAWVNTFDEFSTAPGEFAAIDGGTVVKDYMHRQERAAYYEDETTQLVVLPMKGGVNAAFVLGDTSKIREKLDVAEWQEVIVTLPKFEIESSFDNSELVEYLKATGAGVAFTDDADFSAMCPDTPWCIDDIIQKAKIKVDEDGIEAAAVTAIMMAGSAFNPDPPQPKEFTADRPFSFYLYTDAGDSPELLFYGQYVK